MSHNLKLAPCPFCHGEELEIHRGWHDGSSNQVTITCLVCDVLFWMDSVADNYIDQWNLRKKQS
jgi:hypothetical protein